MWGCVEQKEAGGALWYLGEEFPRGGEEDKQSTKHSTASGPGCPGIKGGSGRGGPVRRAQPS